MTTMNLREAAQQALEAMEDLDGTLFPNQLAAITALRAALAEPTQEELRRLHALNAELVEALKRIASTDYRGNQPQEVAIARAALAKVEAQR